MPGSVDIFKRYERHAPGVGTQDHPAGLEHLAVAEDSLHGTPRSPEATQAEGKFYEIRTWHDTRLLVSPETGIVVSGGAKASAAGFVRLIAFIPIADENVCFLLPESQIRHPVTISEFQFRGQIISLRATRSNDAGYRSFYNPVSGLYLEADPPSEDLQVGSVAIDRTAIGGWEQFAPRELRPTTLPKDVIAAAARVSALLRSGINLGGLMHILEHESFPGSGEAPDWISCIEAVAHLMRPDEIDDFAKWIAGSPIGLRKLSSIYASDIDANLALPCIVDWLASRSTSESRDKLPADIADRAFGSWFERQRQGSTEAVPSRERRVPSKVGPQFDVLAARNYPGFQASFPHACTGSLRASARANRDICVIATARNEGLYLLEWIAYHRAIGVDGFFLYTNDSTDDSDALLAALAEAGLIMWFDNQVAVDGNPQDKAYGHALGVLPEILDYRWALIIDLDEFFVFNPDVFGSIAEYMIWQEVQPVDAVALNWVFLALAGTLVGMMSRSRTVSYGNWNLAR